MEIIELWCNSSIIIAIDTPTAIEKKVVSNKLKSLHGSATLRRHQDFCDWRLEYLKLRQCTKTVRILICTVNQKQLYIARTRKKLSHYTALWPWYLDTEAWRTIFLGETKLLNQMRGHKRRTRKLELGRTIQPKNSVFAATFFQQKKSLCFRRFYFMHWLAGKC